MGWFQILFELYQVVKKYGPQAVQVIHKVDEFLAARDYAGLLAYLESLLNLPIPPLPRTELQPFVDRIRALNP